MAKQSSKRSVSCKRCGKTFGSAKGYVSHRANDYCKKAKP